MGFPAKKLVELSLQERSNIAPSQDAPGPRLAPVPVSGDDLWKDVFVHQPLPWGRFFQSAVLHTTAFVVIWGLSLAWLRQQKLIGPAPFDRSSVITYAPNEYLPPLDTGKAASPKEEKGDIAYNKQPILSVPREADNRSQTIVAPTDLKLDQNVPLPNIIATGAIAPVVPLDATRSLSSRVKTPDQQVIAPAPEANFARDRANQTLRSEIVPPPVEVSHDRARGVSGPEASIVEPPPDVTTSKSRRGDVNIGPSQVVAPAPQLAMAEQHTLGRGRGGKGLPGSAEPVAPAPSIAVGGGSENSGRLIALSINPAAPTGPVQVPSGSRLGKFQAGPNGKAGASGSPNLAGGRAGSNGAGGTSTGNGSGGHGNSSLPSGLHVGGVPGERTGSVQRDGKSPNGTGAGDGDAREMASLTPAQVAAAKREQRPAKQISDEKITDIDRQVFGDRHPYAMTVNMPNLNSATGSWVLRFAELKQDEKPGVLFTPVPTHQTDPGYPLELMKNNVHGQVTLYAVIHSDGRIGDIRVLNSPDDRLDSYAVSALKHWTFVPAEKDGKPVAIEAVVVIPFRTRTQF
ncbi:MAG TPA: TonB family protein [Terriglobales bacterium]|nr:TonB family protein [Terriglobales bacterium]